MTLKMTSAQVVETSVIVNNNSSFQNYTNPDDHTQQTKYFNACYTINQGRDQYICMRYKVVDSVGSGRQISLALGSFLKTLDNKTFDLNLENAFKCRQNCTIRLMPHIGFYGLARTETL